jgi:hypothetical protein
MSTTGEPWEDESTFTLTGAATVPANDVVLPRNTWVESRYCWTTFHRNADGKPVPEYELPPHDDGEIMATRPSDDHVLVMAAWLIAHSSAR